MNSAACWVPLAVAVALLVGALVKGKGSFILFALVVTAVSGFGSYYWFGNVEDAADARDRYVVEALADGNVTFVDFLDEDTERVRVSREIDNKKCEATFDVLLGNYEHRWPLQPGSGRHPSSGCGLDDMKDGGGRFDDSPSAVALSLDRLFARM
jgi:hypothetical protein